MSRDLFYAAEKRKRNYGEMMSMSSMNAPKGSMGGSNAPPKKLYKITGIKDNSNQESTSKEAPVKLTEDSLKILAYLQNKERNTEEKPKGSLVGTLGSKSSKTNQSEKQSEERKPELLNPFINYNKDNSSKDKALTKNLCNTESGFSTTGTTLSNPFLSGNSGNSILNPFLQPLSVAPDISLPTHFDSAKNTLPNPFLQPLSTIPDPGAPTNFEAEKNKSNNPFLTNGNSLFNFNFDFNKAPVIAAFEEEDRKEEEENANVNPEEEVPILPNGVNEDKSTLPKVKIQSETDKFYTKKLEQFYIYDFDKKKYCSKGKGSISLEIYQNSVTKRVTAILVFRNEGGLKILYQGNILSDVTSIDRSNKPIPVLFVSKVFTMKEEKLINTALKLKFFEMEHTNEFISKFEELQKRIREPSEENKLEAKEDKKEGKDEENATNGVEQPKKVTTIRVKCMKKY